MQINLTAHGYKEGVWLICLQSCEEVILYSPSMNVLLHDDG